MDIKELKEILRTSIRSKRLLEIVSIGAVKVGNEYIIIKQRPYYEFEEGKIVYYDEEHEMSYAYRELIGETVVYGHSLFNRSGQAAIREYLKLSSK